MTTHCVGYDRQSEERRNHSSASPATQRSANYGEFERRLSRGEDIVWIKHFSEKPGTSAFGGVRPVFEQLLSECRMGRVNMIIVMYVSRFSREDPLDAIPVVTELLNLGVTIVSTAEGEFRKGNLMDLIHLIMRLDQAHNESKNKSLAVRQAHNLARGLGGVVGKVPFGFDFEPVAVKNPGDGNKLVVIQRPKHNRVESRVIKEVWKTIKHHKDNPDTARGGIQLGSLTGICKQMTTDRVPTKGANGGGRTADSIWDPATLKRALRDPWIAGFQRDTEFARDALGMPTKSVIGYKIRRDTETGQPLLLHCGPIIDPAEWYELQEWLDTRGRGKGNHHAEYLLTALDFLYCESGAVMVGHRSGDKSSYECKNARGVAGHRPGSCTIQTGILDNYVANMVFTLISMAEGDDNTLPIIAEAIRRLGELEESPAIANERRALVAARAESTKSLAELYEDREAGAYNNPVGRKAFIQGAAAHTASVEAADRRLLELDALEAPVLPIGEWLAEPGDDPIGPGSWWHDVADATDRRNFLRLFVDRITVTQANRQRVPVEDRVEITWAIAPNEDAS